MTTGTIRSSTADRLMSIRVTRRTLSFVMNTMCSSVDLRESIYFVVSVGTMFVGLYFQLSKSISTTHISCHVAI